jgi:hypothetical protein
MNEQDFRNALRHTMTAEAPPPPMSDSPVLDAAHRERGRRRAMWAGVGSAVAVVAIAVGVVVVGPSGDEGVQVGGPAVQTTDTANQPQTGTASPETKSTETSWPNGQTDRTATAGPRFDRGVTLGTALAAVIPAGYESPDDLTGGDATSGTYPLKHTQAQYMDTIDGNEVWSYDAWVPVTKGNGVGELSVNVVMPGLGGTGQACDIAQAMGLPEPKCTEVTVDGKKVGIFDVIVDGGQEQGAVYRFDDGTSVVVTQSSVYSNSGQPALDGLPMTAEQLAALAIDSRFNVD